MIIRTKRYIKELKNILTFIAKDSLNNSRKFKKELDDKINKIPNYPQIYKKVINHGWVKDLIFKGFVAVFRIKDDDIYILGIYKHNLWKN